MLKFIKNKKLILIIVIVIIIISISTYFIIKKTIDGFISQDDINWCKTTQSTYGVIPNVTWWGKRDGITYDERATWTALDCNNLVNMTDLPLSLQQHTYPTNNYVRGRYFRIEKDTDAVNASNLSEYISNMSHISNKEIAKTLNIGGVLIYDNYGKLININPTGGRLRYDNSLSDDYLDGNINTAYNCLKIVQYNKNRTLADATITMPQTDGNLTLYNYLDYMNNSITTSSGIPNIYWEYDFGSDVNIAGFEILPRSDRCAICLNFLKVKVFADSDSLNNLTPLNIDNAFDILSPLNISDTFDIFPGITTYDYIIPDTFFDTPKENVSYFYIKPLVQPQPPTTSTMEPTTSTMEPTTSTMEPTTSTMEPTTSTMEPTTSTMEPTTSTMEPTTSTMEPTTSTMEPTTQSTMPTTQSTMPTTQSTMPTTQSTMPTTQSTMPTTQSTMPTTQSTMPTTQSTMPTTQSTMSITTKQSSISTIPNTNVPKITTKQLVNLLNSGYGSYLDTDTITSDGISMRNAYKGPSTNIVQTNFSGTSNIYAPYLYYNTGTYETFGSSTYDAGQYNYKIYK